MQKLVYENFHKSKETFVEALQCEDYEEEGKLELSQLIEAIVTVNEDLEKSVLDYMLYYVIIRSENHDEMQYKHLIDLVETLMKQKSEAQ